MKWWADPEVLDAMPERLAELYRELESYLLEEICSRLKIRDNLNEVTLQDIRALRGHGISIAEIEKAIRDNTGLSQRRLKSLINDAVKRNEEYYRELITLSDLTQPLTLLGAKDVAAIEKQTLGELTNISRSMGFLVDNGRTMLRPAKAYQWALDNAILQMDSASVSYGEAIKGAVKQLADSGLKVVTYESGHIDHADVAVRRAVLTGIGQLCNKYAIKSMEILKTEYVEVTAHAGARDKDGINPWDNHKAWQGKVYHVKSGDLERMKDIEML